MSGFVGVLEKADLSTSPIALSSDGFGRDNKEFCCFG
jgi:hypothetical protein